MLFTIFAIFLCTNTSPGPNPIISFAGTRESELDQGLDQKSRHFLNSPSDPEDLWRMLFHEFGKEVWVVGDHILCPFAVILEEVFDSNKTRLGVDGREDLFALFLFWEGFHDRGE